MTVRGKVGEEGDPLAEVTPDSRETVPVSPTGAGCPPARHSSDLPRGCQSPLLQNELRGKAASLNRNPHNSVCVWSRYSNAALRLLSTVSHYLDGELDRVDQGSLLALECT